jgi:ubiquitin-protein ligase
VPTLQLANPNIYFHPNISKSTGYICEKTLKDKSITLKVRDRIDAFIRLLYNPNCSDALNGEAARLYEEDFTQYCRKAFFIFRGLQKMG